MGTGSVKGFGVTLTIGVAASLFTALVVTRLIFDFLLAKNWLKSLPMLHIIRATKLDFMKLAKPAFVAVLAVDLHRHGLRHFHPRQKFVRRGFRRRRHTITLTFEQKRRMDQRAPSAKTSASKIRIIEYQKDRSARHATLRVTVRLPAAKAGRKRSLASCNGISGGKFQASGVDQVGANRRQGNPTTAILASLLAMFGILIYVAFRYEFSFAVGAVVAVIHDVLMTLGWYFLAGREFNATTVAAILTIIGFSINDTIVIFDRIREDLKLGVRGTFREVMNQALNQTLEPHDHHLRHGVSGHAVALHFRRRRHQRLRVHLPRRHPHRHLFVHLHRQRAGPLVAQRPTAEHRQRRKM